MVVVVHGVSPATVHAKGADPFEPSRYIEQQGSGQIEAGTTLLTRGVYRVNGRRYLKYSSAAGAVYLPAVGALPDLNDALAVCPQHLGLMREVLSLRDHLPVDSDTRDREGAIVELIARCQQGLIAGPVWRERQPDGAVVERQAKSSK